MSATTDRITPKEEAPSVCLMSWVSWRSIFAGAIASVAIGLVLGLLGVALGFTMVDPLDSNPLAGVGLSFGIWTLISGVASLTAGGYIAGMFAGQRGCTHGFLVWSAVMLIGAFTTFSAAGMAARGAAGFMESGLSAAATAASGPAAALADRGMDRMLERSSSEQDPQILSILRDTGVQQLQPSFWMGQMADVRRDMNTSMRTLTLDNYDARIAAFLDRQQERLEAIRNRPVDRNEAVAGLMRNRGISRDQAEMLLSEALPVYNYRLDQVATAIEQSRQNFEDARGYLKETVEDARREADEAASAAAKSALMSAIALILGAVGAMFGGKFGVRRSLHCHTL